MEVLANILQPKVAEMTAEDYANLQFGEFYRALPPAQKAPKQAFVEAIAELCCVHQQTVRMWINGVQRPNALAQRAIAEYMEMPIETLFPPKQQEELCEQ